MSRDLTCCEATVGDEQPTVDEDSSDGAAALLMATHLTGPPEWLCDTGLAAAAAGNGFTTDDKDAAGGALACCDEDGMNVVLGGRTAEPDLTKTPPPSGALYRLNDTGRLCVSTAMPPHSDTGLQLAPALRCSPLTHCWLSCCCSCSWSWSISALVVVKLGTVLLLKLGTEPLVSPFSMLTHRPACPRITGEPDSWGKEWISGEPLWAEICTNNQQKLVHLTYKILKW